MTVHEMHEQKPGDWFTPAEAARMLPSVRGRTVQNWAAKGMLKGAIQLPSGQWRIPREAVEAILRGEGGPSDG
ncbi:helix-turn-helix domain-containing protein [Corynebacterium sp. 13CS0277]|uniref:helix-turn-helix domain-containing protein n=1 Tax=Corynebacterium sp. 13CS0277 TaxID=2071994 RepID=UPI0011B23257